VCWPNRNEALSLVVGPVQLSELNQLDGAAARAEMLRCCHSSRWADGMVHERPYNSFDDLVQHGATLWNSLSSEDWLEAFSAHPKIGDMASLRAKYRSTSGWASGEQSGVDNAQEEVLRGLAEGNQTYETKYGYIFIVCATGKTAAEMLEILRSRMDNEPARELFIAAEEQNKITKIRLEKLCQEVQSQPTF